MKTCQSYSMMFLKMDCSLCQIWEFKLDDWHVEMYLLIWRSLGFAQLDLIWKKKNQKRTTQLSFDLESVSI